MTAPLPDDRPAPTAPVSDTTSAAAEIQAAALRRLSARDRLELAVDMSSVARALLRSRLQAAHPDWSVDDLNRAILRSTLPDAALPPSVP